MAEPDYEKQEEEFDAIWEKRHGAPTVTESWTSNEWAKGRTEYITFLIRVEDREIARIVRVIQEELVKFHCIDPFPDEYLHITVKETGRFLIENKTAQDEYTRADLPAITREARRILDEYTPFQVRLRNINNFKSTVCVQAHDGGVIRGINRDLLSVPGMARMRHDFPVFLPHLSVAQYKSLRDYEQLVRRLEDIRETRVGDLNVESIQLVIAHLPTSGRYPRLETIAEYKL